MFLAQGKHIDCRESDNGRVDPQCLEIYVHPSALFTVAAPSSRPGFPVFQEAGSLVFGERRVSAVEDIGDKELVHRFDHAPDVRFDRKEFRYVLEKLHGFHALFVYRVDGESAPVNRIIVAALFVSEKQVLGPVIETIGDKRKDILRQDDIPSPVIAVVLTDMAEGNGKEIDRTDELFCEALHEFFLVFVFVFALRLLHEHDDGFYSHFLDEPVGQQAVFAERKKEERRFLQVVALAFREIKMVQALELRYEIGVIKGADEGDDRVVTERVYVHRNAVHEELEKQRLDYGVVEMVYDVFLFRNRQVPGDRVGQVIGKKFVEVLGKSAPDLFTILDAVSPVVDGNLDGVFEDLIIYMQTIASLP
jgi:hypothetical protein